MLRAVVFIADFGVLLISTGHAAAALRPRRAAVCSQRKRGLASAAARMLRKQRLSLSLRCFCAAMLRCGAVFALLQRYSFALRYACM